MRYSSWLEAFKNDPHQTTYNDNAATILDIIPGATDKDDCIEKVSKVTDLISISCNPITHEFQVLHHMQYIGGTIASPEKALVAIRGDKSTSQVVQFEHLVFGWKE